MMPHTIAVLAIQAAAGLGPILSVSATPRIRAVYTRLKDPVFPITAGKRGRP